MTESADAGKDLVGGLRPHEGFGMAVRQADVGPDRLLELPRAAMHRTPQLFVGEGRKPALHEIDPGRAGRSEMQMDARMAEQPAVDQWGLVGARIVENE